MKLNDATLAALNEPCVECGHKAVVTLILGEQADKARANVEQLAAERDEARDVIQRLHSEEAARDLELAALEAQRDHYRMALAAQAARVRLTPLERQVLDDARHWASLRPPHPAGAPARSVVQAAEQVLERSVLAMEAEAKRAAEGLTWSNVS